MNSRKPTGPRRLLQRLVHPLPASCRPAVPGTSGLRYPARSVRRRSPPRFWCVEPRARPGGSTGTGSAFRPARLATAPAGPGRSSWDGWCPLPTPPPDATSPAILEAVVAARKPKSTDPAPQAPDDLPVRHRHAAGVDVDVGQASHWVCVESTPDGSDAVREFPAHTPGLRLLVDWLRVCRVATVALEAGGAYGHVPFLTLIEAGFPVVVTSPAFARQIEGRPKTDRRDCQWIQRLHKHGLLAPRLPAGRGHPDAAELRPPAGQLGPPVRPARPAHAEGPRTHEPQAHHRARRRDRRRRG